MTDIADTGTGISVLPAGISARGMRTCGPAGPVVIITLRLRAEALNVRIEYVLWKVRRQAS